MFGRVEYARGGKVFGVAMAAAVVWGSGSGGAANADTFIPLPGGQISRTLDDGTVLTVRIDNESAKISPSMGSTPAHRNVWVTGRGSVDVSGPSAATSTIKISPGYIVGCQVDIGQFSESENGTGTGAPGSGGAAPTFTPSQTFGGGLSLGPGQAVARLMLDLEAPDDYGQEKHNRYNKTPGPHASVSWVDEAFEVNGCGGYAQARSFVLISAYTDTQIGDVTVWGQPFSMG
ncbi:MspA family porin [Nocardia sp. NPDC020380]|uniref:MspA family porin n=1 Tax=Nocardia sp. NPDC020380 TaxID=3364309 RepID=UPI0037A63B44